MTRTPRLLLSVALAGAATLASSLQAQTAYQWLPLTSGNASGSWNSAANWNPAGPAAGVDNTASFVQSITSAATVTLDADQTIGNLFFGVTGGSNFNWAVNSGTPTTSRLFLSSSAGQAGVAVTNQTATIGAPVTAPGGLWKSGAGVLVLGAANSFAGSNYVSAGTLRLNNVGALNGASAVGVPSGGRVQPGVSGTYGNVPLFLAGQGIADARGALYVNVDGGNIVLPQDITMTADTRIGAYSGGGTYSLSGAISGATNLNLWSGGGAYTHMQTWVLSGSNTYSGSTTLEAGFGSGQTVRLSGGPDRLPTTTRLTINTSWADGSSRPAPGNFDLGGNNQTLAGLTISSGAKTNINSLISSSANMPTLTINGGGASAINFAVQGGVPVLNISNVVLNVNTEPAYDLRTIIQNGATINLQKGTYNSSFYTALGRTGNGTINVTNGLFSNTGELLMAYGGTGVGYLNVGGAGVADMHFIRLGNTTPGSAVTLNSGGTIRANQVSTYASATNNYFIFNGGLLQANTSPAGGGASWFGGANVTALVRSNGAAISTQDKNGAAHNLTISKPLLPEAGSTGGLVKLGAGTLRLADAWTYNATVIDTNTVPPTTNIVAVTVPITNSYAGPTTVSNGTLMVDGAIDVSAVTLQPGTTLAGTGYVARTTALTGASVAPGASGTFGTLTVSNLTAAGSNQFLFDLSPDGSAVGSGVNDLLALNNISLGSQTVVGLEFPMGYPYASNRYVVATYSGSSSGLAGLVLAPQLIGSRAAIGMDVGTPGQVAVILTNGAPPNTYLTWYGNSPNNSWDLNQTPNWSYGTETFYNSDSVTFDDSAQTNVVRLVGTLAPAAITFNNNSQPYSFYGSGKISGAATLSLAGYYGVTIATDNDNTGATTVGGAGITLQIGNGGTSGAIGSGDVQFTWAGNTLAYNRTDSLTLINRIYGGSGLEPLVQVNSGALTLAGTADNSWATATVNSGAALTLAKASGSGVHALGGIGTALTIDSGATAKFGGTGGDQIYDGRDVLNEGTLDLGSQSEAVNNLVGSGRVINSTAGDGVLSVGSANAEIAFSGVFQDGVGKAGLTKLGSGTMTVTTTNTATGPLTVVGSGLVYLSNPTAPAWAGPVTINNNAGANPRLILQAPEQIGDTSILSFGGSGTERRFQLNGFNETIGGLNDLAGVAGNRIVEAAADGVENSPATLTLNVPAGVTNTLNAYVRNAVGALNSALTIVKKGAGTQTFSGVGTVDYSGPTTVEAGVLEVSGANSVLANSAITLAGGTMKFSGGGTRAMPIPGHGALQVGGGTLILPTNLTYTGSTLISAGTLQLGDGNANGSIATDVTDNGGFTIKVATNTVQTFAGSISGTGSFTKDAFGTLHLTGSNSFAGNATISAGALWINNSQGLGTGTKTVSINNGTAGNPSLHLNGTNGSINLPATFSFNTSWANGTIYNEAGNNSIAGNISLTAGGGDTYVLANGGTLTLAGIISPSTTGRGLRLGGSARGTVSGNIINSSSTNTLAALHKMDAGTWTLAGTNLFTGPTTVEAGTLLVNGSLATNTVAVFTNSTLGGSGIILGAVTVQNGGTLAPGTSVGVLTISNVLTLAALSTNLFELNAALGTNDAVTGISTVTYGGALLLSNVSGTFTGGQSFKLFTAANYAVATFASIQWPTLGSGLAWTNRLNQDGTIAVYSTTPPQPIITSWTLSGSDLLLHGSNGAPNATFRVLASPSVTAPVNTWVPLTQAGTFGSDGTFNYTVPVNPALPQQFLLLSVP